MIILIFQVKYLKNLCELDARVIACNFYVFGIFSFFSDFFRSNLFIFEPKVEKIYMGVFSTHFVPLISNLAPKIMEEWNNQFQKLWFLQATEALCHLCVTNIKKPFYNIWFFCKNQACANCTGWNATTVTWLLWVATCCSRIILCNYYQSPWKS